MLQPGFQLSAVKIALKPKGHRFHGDMAVVMVMVMVKAVVMVGPIAIASCSRPCKAQHKLRRQVPPADRHQHGARP